MRPARALELLVAVASVVLAGATEVLLRPAEGFVGTLVLVGTAWGSFAFVAGAFSRTPPAARQPGPRTGSVTTVVRLGAESDDVARPSIVLAAQAGPTVVLSTGRRELLDELAAAIDVDLHVAPTLEAAFAEAVGSITTDAILFVSASAFPVADACARAAGRLGGDVGWVVGSAPSFNADSFAPSEREVLRARVRSQIRAAGGDAWEPDATIVRSDLARAVPFEPGLPSGAWMRTQRAHGFRGVDVCEAVARRAAPADAPLFWPTELLRRRAAAADLAGAMRAGPCRARATAASALLRELWGWSLLIWTLIPMGVAWSGQFPLRCSPALFFGCAAVVAGARWITSRLTYRIRLHPLREARAGAYDAPSSVLALSSAVTGRVRPVRFRIPDQPLLAAAVVLSLVTTVALVDRAPVANHALDVPVALAIVELVLMWLFAVRALGKGAWERSGYRLAIDIPVFVNGRPARALNASPRGLAVAGHLPDMGRGSVVSISIPCSDSTTLDTTAVVARRRPTPHGAVVGMSLSMNDVDRVRWIRELFSAADIPAQDAIAAFGVRKARAVLDSDGGRSRILSSLIARAELLVVGVTAATALATLSLLGLGYRPLIVRSASMEPALVVGDVVVVEWT
ncbi:MAG TPA: hypothetical protein VEZ15_12585, partial [Acidimicrobiia bacterium]|nr:hypothetical protein [Acidimicrobiia bacterium]